MSQTQSIHGPPDQEIHLVHHNQEIHPVHHVEDIRKKKKYGYQKLV